MFSPIHVGYVSNRINENLILYFEIYLSGLLCSCAILIRSLTPKGESELRVTRSRRIDHESHSVGCVANAVAIHAGSGERSLKRIDPRRTTPFPGSS
jgi:hypothetical protein